MNKPKEILGGRKNNSSSRKTRKNLRTKSKKIRGGGCACNKLFKGGYGPATYQGGLDKFIYPLNSHNSDPTNPSAITAGRFQNGGKRKSRKMRN
jgi:hypothetical protein